MYNLSMNAEQTKKQIGKWKPRRKRVFWLALIAVLLLMGGTGTYALTRDVPGYAIDEVITVAKNFSPDCRLQLTPKRISH